MNVDLPFAELLAQPLAGLIGLEPQRVVGLDAHLELHAALEVEAELELLVHQPAGRWMPVRAARIG